MLKRFMAMLIMTAVVVSAGGCLSHAQAKKAALQRWEKASARIKLPVAQQEFDNGKYADAVKTVSECLKADPNLPQAHLLAGKILFVQGQSAGCVAELEKAVKIDEKLDDGWYWLGLVAEENEQTDKASQYYQKALNLNGSNIEYILAAARASVTLDKADEALALLRDKIGVFPSEVELKAKCADLLCSKQKYDEAIALYRQVVLLAPQREDIAESFGYCCMLAKRWADASEVFTKLSVSCPDENKKSVYLQLSGMCQVNAGQYGSAMISYSKLNAKERDSVQVWLRMGQAALGVNDADKAYTCSQRALALQPGCTDAIAVKGSAEYLRKNYREAIRSFEQIVSDPKQEAFAWMMLSRCYENIGESDKARQAAEKMRILSESGQSEKLTRLGD
jgi:tetratricopeptide (TPR) repeat protein